MAYLDAAKKAATVKKMREANKDDVSDVLDEVALAIAAHKSAAVADLNQDISAAYVEAEVQAISDKVDALLAALRTAGLLAT